MSLILDALRKMEQERKARRGGTVDIRPEILTRRGAATRTVGRPALVAGAVILLAAGIGTGLFLKGKGTARKDPGASFARNVSTPAPAPYQPIAPVPAGRPVETAAPQAVPQPAPAPRTLPVAAPASPSPSPAEKGRKRRIPSEDNAPSQAPPASGASESDPGDLKVSGIAWQEERGLRRAVVNGELVKEGAVVAGAKVVAIGERSVRFSRDGQSFAVTYAPGFGGR